MYNANDIANWFLTNLDDITNKKLQKLLYYAYSWYLVLSNNSNDELDLRLFENNFEAWIHGAVYPSIYNKYKEYGASYIPKFSGTLPDFTVDEEDILSQVLTVYGGCSGNELESICHQELPWQNARVGVAPYEPSHNSISDKDIFNCYAQRL